MFVSGSADKTARFWDLRASTAITVVPSSTGTYSPSTAYCRFLLFIRVLNSMIQRFCIKNREYKIAYTNFFPNSK